jgi:hypothetical protein
MRLLGAMTASLRLGIARLLGAFALAMVLIGCMTRAGIGEFVAYSDAFAASRAASNSLFDMLAVAERDVRRQAAPRGNAFEPQDAPAFATIGEPPLTAAYRNAFATITRYNAVMVGLASGQSAGRLSADIVGLATDSLALASVLSPGLAVPIAGFAPLAQSLGQTALTFRTRAVFRQELESSAGDVRRLMETMRDGSPVIFRLLADAGQTTLGGDDSRREKLREVVSDWVILMNRNIAALDAAIAAGRSGSEGDIGALRATIAELTDAAQALRTGIAALAMQ